MSELINNRQKRIDTLKGLIRQLHQGTDEAEVKTKIEQLLPDLDYSDVFTAEMQLIQEGIPPQSIQQLCDAHTRVLRAQLDRQQALEMPPGHPLHTFLQENRALSEVIAQVRALVQQVEALPDEQESTDYVRAIQQRLNDLTDVHKHYLRKEYLLFPYFEKNNLMGPPTVMWGKHDEVRYLLREAIASLQSQPAFTAAQAKDCIRQAVLPAINAIEEMIYKEEKILFPVALSLLTEHGRLVYICYYAVRNEQGEYLGTLEVTQDLTEARSLEGERRLLMYDGEAAD